VQQGAFDDLFGRTTGAVPERLSVYKVLPDEQANEVVRERQLLDQFHDSFGWALPGKEGGA
jgi:hypothetical protein